MVLSIYTKNASNRTNTHLGMSLAGQMDGWTEGWIDGRQQNNIAPTSSGGGGGGGGN